MKVALIGATGNVGGVLLEEALGRGHQVTAIARHAAALAPRPGLTVAELDVADMASLSEVLRGHDAVISSVRFLQLSAATLLAPVRASGVGRLLVVGGAGSLQLPDGSRLVDSPSFPAVARAEALAGCEFLAALASQSELSWTFIAPSAQFARGERTGRYRLGLDRLLVDEQGKSWISVEDFAIALLDELQRGRHPSQRITVGY
ncbi:hypothetical protein SAMN05216201_10539 [Pseudomonas linyingensis]|uniref:NAD(P)-binding domain-containing protein n=1 Tax=Pseudomonas linyingensis TaxID=915471 RepID=A0A1H6WPE6_9PSED|nr:NAD(P)-dependent oxidoreductase [Pseudomonas linyingensis]SEJ14245.1 hypothetical protein SAMN05216201_10539 [Pseudomonas linyingensis]